MFLYFDKASRTWTCISGGRLDHAICETGSLVALHGASQWPYTTYTPWKWMRILVLQPSPFAVAHLGSLSVNVCAGKHCLLEAIFPYLLFLSDHPRTQCSALAQNCSSSARWQGSTVASHTLLKLELIEASVLLQPMCSLTRRPVR